MSVDVTKMPKLGFGMMRLPEKDGELDLEQICKMVDAYLASGMNYFDTAYMYCGGKSESIVKKALVERHPRESFTLTTKLPQWMMDEGIEGRDRIFNDHVVHIPLPKRLELTAEEKQIADSLLSAVKAHWSKMNGTSLKGFLQSFVTRTGRLEEQDEKWLLTVDDKTHDILLDSVPWGFRQIRLPWLKKYIQVKWHDKQEF